MTDDDDWFEFEGETHDVFMWHRRMRRRGLELVLVKVSRHRIEYDAEGAPEYTYYYRCLWQRQDMTLPAGMESVAIH